MNFEIIRIVIELIIFDINVVVIARGQQVNRFKDERTCWITKYVLSSVRKETKIHYFILSINLLIVFLESISTFAEYMRRDVYFGRTLINIVSQVRQEWEVILIWGGVIGVLTISFMIMTYRVVGIKPIIDNGDGNRRLNANEIDKEYIEFSKLDSVDSHSKLLLVAGDLSFLGDIPDIKNIMNNKKRSICKTLFLESCTEHGCCNRRCPSNIKNKCIKKSKQLAQLAELRKKGVIFHVICQKPNSDNDISYKQRLGFLKKVFSDSFVIHFLPKETLGSEVCVLARIKVNGGMKELFWHWKDPENHGIYIVPKIKRVDSSENKTLIYLLETVLWESANEIDEDMLNECIDEYERIIN